MTDSIACVPITVCYPNPNAPAMDDMDSLRAFIPGSNPQPTGRVYGSVYFTNATGNAVQPMQGVNVVARLMVSGQPSRQYVSPPPSLDSLFAATPATSSTDTWTETVSSL
jgi:hypothetical protein